MYKVEISSIAVGDENSSIKSITIMIVDDLKKKTPKGLVREPVCELAKFQLRYPGHRPGRRPGFRPVADRFELSRNVQIA